MVNLTSDLNQYKRDREFYGEIPLLVTIKSFDLVEIRKRYLESKNRKDGVTGSLKRREPGMGGVASLRISKGSIQAQNMLIRMKEPRGICRSENYLGISSDSDLILFSKEGRRVISDPWFSYIHTLDINDSESELMLSSSGFDCVFRLSLPNGNKDWEWYAWENGFPTSQTRGENGEEILITRSEQQRSIWESDGKEVIFIRDPNRDHLPTAKRTAFINSAHYANSGQILLTFFHLGQVMSLDPETGKTEPMIQGLKNPHGGRAYNSGVMATSTADGRVIIKAGETVSQYRFSNLPGKPDSLGGMEWVQNSVPCGGLVISIDSNRNCFVIFDPEKKLLDMVPYDPNWALQDMIIGDDSGLDISLSSG